MKLEDLDGWTFTPERPSDWLDGGTVLATTRCNEWAFDVCDGGLVIYRGDDIVCAFDLAPLANHLRNLGYTFLPPGVDVRGGEARREAFAEAAAVCEVLDRGCLSLSDAAGAVRGMK